MQEIDGVSLKNPCGLKVMDYVHPNEVVHDDRQHANRSARGIAVVMRRAGVEGHGVPCEQSQRFESDDGFELTL